MEITDAKKMNAISKREKGCVYGVNEKGLVEFHLLGSLPLKSFENKSLDKLIFDFQKQFEKQQKVNVALKDVIKNQAKRLEYLEKVVEKYGMVD